MDPLRHYKLKQNLCLILLGLLLLPIFQFFLPFVKEKKLDGVDPAPSLPEFSTKTWLSGDYPKQYEIAFEQNIGFHNTLVRLHNQFNYSLWGFSYVPGTLPGKEKYTDVVVGKESYIFLRPYINAYTGADFLGSEYTSIQAQKIKLVQTELKKKNVDFFIVFAPGKGSFYSEYIPDNFKANLKPDSTNYASYKKMFAKYEINNLDLKSYFLSIKNTEQYPLYSTTGVHWTEYACFIAGREITNYIERLRNITLPEIKVQSVEMLSLSGSHSSDYDVANLMNIFTTIPHPVYAIPKLKFDSDSTTVKPRFLCISDSYFSGIINTKIPSNVFNDYHYWLYNDGVYPETFLKEKRRNKKQLRQDLEKQDVVCILSTDATLSQFPYGFIDEAYELYAPKNDAYYALKQKEFHYTVFKTIENIKKNKTWENQLIENAKQKGISKEEEFFQNALWLYKQEQLKLKNE